MLINQSKISCIIVDDEEDPLFLLASLLDEIEEVVILDSIMDPSKVIDSILTNKPDIVFLDIELGNKNGLEILHKIRDLKLNVHIKFVTAYDEYAIKAIKLGASDYLTKPISRSDLKRSINKYLEDREIFGSASRFDNDFKDDFLKIRIPTNKGSLYFNCEEIVYLEAERNYTHLYLNDGKEILSSLNLGKLEVNFPENIFIKISRSCIINKKYLFKVEKSKRRCYLKYENSEIVLKISDTYFKEDFI